MPENNKDISDKVNDASSVNKIANQTGFGYWDPYSAETFTKFCGKKAN